MPRDDGERLDDMLYALDLVARFIEGHDAKSFDEDDLVASAVSYQLLVVGEAAKGLSDEMRGAMPDVAWPQIMSFRDVLAHEYFRVTRGRVWHSASVSAARLAEAIERLQHDEGRS